MVNPLAEMAGLTQFRCVLWLNEKWKQGGKVVVEIYHAIAVNTSGSRQQTCVGTVVFQISGGFDGHRFKKGTVSLLYEVPSL